MSALLTCVSATGFAAGHTIHKCVGADGKTTFSDAPCASKPAGEGDQGAAAAAPPGATSQDGASAAPAAKKDAAAPVAPTCGWTVPDGVVVVDPPRKIDPAELPHDASGQPVEILVSKRGPASVAAACSAMVSACSQKSADPGNAIDICFKSAPRCATGRPWDEDKPCCPEACWQRFSELRTQCVGASTASYRSLFESHCVADGGATNGQPAP